MAAKSEDDSKNNALNFTQLKAATPENKNYPVVVLDPQPHRSSDSKQQSSNQNPIQLNTIQGIKIANFPVSNSGSAETQLQLPDQKAIQLNYKCPWRTMKIEQFMKISLRFKHSWQLLLLESGFFLNYVIK